MSNLGFPAQAGKHGQYHRRHYCLGNMGCSLQSFLKPVYLTIAVHDFVDYACGQPSARQESTFLSRACG